MPDTLTASRIDKVLWDVAEGIANGHAYDKHMVRNREFADLAEKYGINIDDPTAETANRAKFKQLIYDVLKDEKTKSYIEPSGGIKLFNEERVIIVCLNTELSASMAHPEGSAFRLAKGVGRYEEIKYGAVDENGIKISEGLEDKYVRMEKAGMPLPVTTQRDMPNGGLAGRLAHDPGWLEKMEASVIKCKDLLSRKSPAQVVEMKQKQLERQEQSGRQRQDSSELKKKWLALKENSGRDGDGINISVESSKSGHSKFISQEKGGKALGGADVAVRLANGDVAGATQSAVMQAALDDKTYKTAAEVTEKTLPVAAKGAKVLGKKVPLLGALISASTTVSEVGGLAAEGEYAIAAGATAAGLAETGGNLFGFGVGDGLREGVRESLVAAGGAKFEAITKSDIREVGEGAGNIATRFMLTDFTTDPAKLLKMQDDLMASDPLLPATVNKDGKDVKLAEALRDPVFNAKFRQDLVALGAKGDIDTSAQLVKLDTFNTMEIRRQVALGGDRTYQEYQQYSPPPLLGP